MRPPLSPNPIAPYTVFFSHQRRDEAVVREFINIIYSWTENIECFLSENIEKGIDWRNTIAEILTRASVLVMVSLTPTEIGVGFYTRPVFSIRQFKFPTGDILGAYIAYIPLSCSAIAICQFAIRFDNG